MSASGMNDKALVERLRAEAIRSRPAFDAAAAARVVASVRGDAAVGRLRGGRRLRSAVAVAVCLGVVWGGQVWWGHRERPRDGAGGHADTVAVDSPVAGLDALPSLDELGDGMADGIGSLAATVVGLPDWRELAVAELPIVDAWPSDREAGSAAWAAGS
ncbi:MAG: hypothetical protein ACKO40_02440, partial [Planctomycetaceae bacterium]